MKFYFDTDNGDGLVPDNDGLECKDRDEIRRQAIGLLPHLAADVIPDGDEECLTVAVRDDSGKIIFRASLSMNAQWLAED